MASESNQLATASAETTGRELGQREARQRSEWRAGLRVFRRNKLAFVSVVFLLVIHLLAILAPTIAPADPDFIQIGKRFQRPNAEFALGADENGRDVLTRLIYGSRVSLLVGSLSVLISVSIGTLLGALAGYRGGVIDSLIMRFTDGMLTIPTFFLVLIIVTVFGSTLTNIILVIALTSWMVIARIVRGDVLRIVSQDYILAARATGVPPTQLVVRHVLPGTVPNIIVSTTLGVANAILTESALSYLGLGVQPPTSTWGSMLSNAQNYLFRAPELALYPGLLIFITVLAYNFFGDGLHDAMDPRYRHKG